MSKNQFKKQRTTNKIKSITSRPRICIYRSNKYDYVQLIESKTGNCITAMGSFKIKGKNKLEIAKKLGEEFAETLKKKKITTVVFDRRNHKYHGHVKLIAEGLREKGIKF